VLWRCAGDLPTFRPGTAEFVTAGTNSVLFHDLGGEGAEFLREMPLRGRLPIAAFDGKGQHLLVAHSQGVEWLDLAAGETQLIAAEQGLGPTGVAVSADGAVAAYCGQGSVAEWRVWRTSDFTSVARHELKSRPVDLALHPSGQFLAIASEGRDIEIWDLVGNTTVSRLPDAKGAWDLHFAGRRSDRLIACCVGTTIRIWDWKLGQEILTLPFDRRVSGLCFSDDGTALATGSYKT
jgi:WD40 repeat protein